MRGFWRSLVIFGLLVTALSVLIPLRYGVTYPKPLGPSLDNYVRPKDFEEITTRQAEVVLVGDSILVLGIDPEELTRLTGRETYSMGTPGSASAVWYLSIKNVITKVPVPPKYVVVFFRDTILTAPGYRVNGKYFNLVDELAYRDDALLLQKAFIAQMGPVEQVFDQYFPLYGSRLRLRETIDYYIRYGLTNLLGCDAACNDRANIAVFQDLNIDNSLLVEAIATAESYLYTPERLDFDNQIGKSFLPDMVQRAQDKGIQIILVRTKHQIYPTEASQPLALRDYIEKLEAYASENGLVYLDFSHDERLTPDLFADSHHLNERGSQVFTEILTEALLPILNK